MSPKVILITGARAPAALDLARSFTAGGAVVHMADSSSCRMARWSRSVVQVHRLASPTTHPDAFGRDVRALTTRLQPDLIVPVCEEVFHLAAMAQRWPELESRLFAPGFAVLRHLHSKALFADLCRIHGLRTPDVRTVENRAELEALTTPTDLVLKPEYSRFGVHTLIRPSRDRLHALDPSPTRRWVAQRHVEGSEVSFYAICKAGGLTAFSAYASRWRDRGGASYVFEPAPAEIVAELRAMAALLAKRAVVQGQFACDAIVGRDGRPWLIECNPRATSGVHLFDRDPRLARAITDVGDGAALEPADDRSRLLGPAYWGTGLPAALRSGRLGAWREGLRHGRDVLGAPGDLLPLAGAIIDAADFAIRAWTSRRSLPAAMTADIEWNGGDL